MEQTQRIDPNQIPDPNRTQAMPGGADPNRTQAMPVGAPTGPPLTLQITQGRSVTLAHGVSRERVLFELIATGAMTGGRAPLNLCLVIDKSGSMEGEPLEYVKRACAYVVDLLTDRDVLSIVTFEEIVEVLMPPRRVLNKELIKQNIQRLQVGNTTNLYDGLSLGLQQLAAGKQPGYLDRLVLFSDGEPTAGIKDFSAITQLAGGAKERSIPINALGFGPDYNEELIAGIARRSGGKYHYIDRPERIPEVFRDDLEKMMNVVARSPRLELQLARWVQIRQAFGAEMNLASRTATLSMVDLERGARLTPLIEFDFPNHPAGSYRAAKVKLAYVNPVTEAEETITADLIFEFTTDAVRANQPEDARVAGEAQVAIASRALEKTIMGMKTHQLNPTMALHELQKTQQILLQQGRTAEASEIGKAIGDLQRQDMSSVEKTLIGAALDLEQGKKQE